MPVFDYAPLETQVTAPDLTSLIGRAERVLAQLEAWLPPAPPDIDWSAHAFRWRKRGARGWLDAVRHISTIHVEDLQHIERQKAIIDRKSTRLNSSHVKISYAVFCLKKKTSRSR